MKSISLPIRVWSILSGMLNQQVRKTFLLICFEGSSDVIESEWQVYEDTGYCGPGKSLGGQR
jgi:hypothetical protein